MPYSGFLFGHDDQQKTQRSALRALAGKDTIRFFAEPQVDNKYDIQDREVLQKALRYFNIELHHSVVQDGYLRAQL